MARTFSPPSDCLEVVAVPQNNYPLSFAAWFNMDVGASAGGGSLISYGSVGAWEYLSLSVGGGAGVNQVVGAFQIDTVTAKYAVATANHSQGVWHHACLRMNSATEMDVFLDGGNKGSNATSLAWPGNLVRTEIGRILMNSIQYQPFDGSIAEAAIWDATLSDAEVAILALGESAQRVHHQNLVAYYRLLRNDNDIVGGYNMAAVGAPGVSDHPRVRYGPAPCLGRGLPRRLVNPSVYDGIGIF